MSENISGRNAVLGTRPLRVGESGTWLGVEFNARPYLSI
jgi:hypothetical protein